MMNDEFYVDLPDATIFRPETTKQLSEFVKDRVIALNRALKTSQSEREMTALVSDITLCAASLTLISIASMQEDEDITRFAKEIIREVF